jgi:hypothetical protein
LLVSTGALPEPAIQVPAPHRCEQRAALGHRRAQKGIGLPVEVEDALEGEQLGGLALVRGTRWVGFPMGSGRLMPKAGTVSTESRHGKVHAEKIRQQGREAGTHLIGGRHRALEGCPILVV